MLCNSHSFSLSLSQYARVNEIFAATNGTLHRHRQKRTNHNIVWARTNNNSATEKKTLQQITSKESPMCARKKKISSIYEASGKRSTLIQWIFNEVRNNGFLFSSLSSFRIRAALFALFVHWLFIARVESSECVFFSLFFVCTLQSSSFNIISVSFCFVVISFQSLLLCIFQIRFFFAHFFPHSSTNQLWKKNIVCLFNR